MSMHVAGLRGSGAAHCVSHLGVLLAVLCGMTALGWCGPALAEGEAEAEASFRLVGQQRSDAGVEVRSLANAGFLLRTDGAGVLIDAFVAEPYSVYDAVSSETLREMILGGAPFHQMQVALTSHRHEDHFQADVAALFLERRPQVTLVTSPQVIETLRAFAGRLPDNAQAVWPDAGTTKSWSHTAGIQIEFLRIPHGSARHAGVQNLAHIVTLGGRRILHLGDATMEPEAYAPYAELLEGVDIALIPYWFFEDEDGRKTLDTWLQAPVQIAMHLPVGEEETILQRLQESHPLVRGFTSPLQFLRY